MSARCFAFLVVLVCVWTFDVFHAQRFEEYRSDNDDDVLKNLFSDSEDTKEKEDRRVRLENQRVLCEVVKKRVEFKISGMTHKPDSLMFHACSETNVTRYPVIQEMIDFGSDRDDKEFCWISRERSPPRCETMHQQVAVFSREFGSSLWSYQNVHVPAGCGCHLGLKHFN